MGTTEDERFFVEGPGFRMTFLLDTNVISELRPPERATPAVVKWVGSQAKDALFCSVVSILELQTGSLRMLRHDELQGTMLQTWIDGQVLPRRSRSDAPRSMFPTHARTVTPISQPRRWCTTSPWSPATRVTSSRPA